MRRPDEIIPPLTEGQSEIERIPLTEDEEKWIAHLALRAPEDSKRLAQTLMLVRVAATQVAELAGEEGREGFVALMGIVRRTHELLVGGIVAVNTDNRHLFAAAMRSLIETVGAAAYVNAQPDALPSLMKDPVDLAVLVRAAKRHFDGVGRDYGRLSKWIHPSAASLMGKVLVIDEAERRAAVSIPAPALSAGEVVECARALFALGQKLLDLVATLLADHPDAVRRGALLMGLIVPAR
jgi:hypothetical protein